MTHDLPQGNWKEALGLFDMMRSHNGPCPPNAVTFSALMSAALAQGDMHVVKQVGSVLGIMQFIVQ